MTDLISTLIKIDGYLFLLIGVIVLITPSPQPGLTKKVNEEDLLPFSQTRRLLASMFIASALLLIVVGHSVTEYEILRKVGDGQGCVVWVGDRTQCQSICKQAVEGCTTHCTDVDFQYHECNLPILYFAS